jgi:hypothetical protein
MTLSILLPCFCASHLGALLLYCHSLPLCFFPSSTSTPQKHHHCKCAEQLIGHRMQARLGKEESKLLQGLVGWSAIQLSSRSETVQRSHFFHLIPKWKLSLITEGNGRKKKIEAISASKSLHHQQVEEIQLSLLGFQTHRLRFFSHVKCLSTFQGWPWCLFKINFTPIFLPNYRLSAIPSSQCNHRNL